MIVRLLIYPIRKLYLYGPRWGSVGFWEGRQREDICAEITGSPASFWKQSEAQCNALIDRKVQSVAVLLAVSAYTYLMVAGFTSVVSGLTGALANFMYRSTIDAEGRAPQ